MTCPCACTLTDDEETVASPCGAHITWAREMHLRAVEDNPIAKNSFTKDELLTMVRVLEFAQNRLKADGEKWEGLIDVERGLRVLDQLSAKAAGMFDRLPKTEASVGGTVLKG